MCVGAERQTVERFLKSQGKQKYTVSVYRALHKASDEHRKFVSFCAPCQGLVAKGRRDGRKSIIRTR